MKIERRYTTANNGPYYGIEFKTVNSAIGGMTIKDVDVPTTWSQTATDILAHKYLRKAGVPDKTFRIVEDGVPEWLQRRGCHSSECGAERSAKQVFDRMAGTWTY